MHDLNLAYLFSDNVLVLKEGEVQGFESPKTLLDEAFVQSVFDVKVQRIENKGLFVVP
jgi:ABC-type cobalamin/Fe3+-siderophores transport system ATPase subunit